MGIEAGGLIGIIVLILNIMAILKIVNSRESAFGKAIWIVAILVLPIIGLLIWYLAGPKG